MTTPTQNNSPINSEEGGIMQKNPRYKVEHYTAEGAWVPSHQGVFQTYKEALELKGNMGRVLIDALSDGDWEVVESFPSPGFAGE